MDLDDAASELTPQPPADATPTPGRRAAVALAAVLAVAGGLVAAGATIVSPPAGFITGGILLAAWALLVLRGAAS